MNDIIYIFGHKKPDTDSVCSAIAYANLKNTIDQKRKYVPIILGDMNKETTFVLERLGIEPPKVKKHLKPQIQDMAFETPTYVYESSSIKETLDKLTHDYGRILPVIGQYKNLIGVVSFSDVLPYYMDSQATGFLKNAQTPFQNLIEHLELTIAQGMIPYDTVRGRVLLIDDLKNEILDDDDILICSYNYVISKHYETIPSKPNIMICTNWPEDKNVDFTFEGNVLLTTPASTNCVLKIINQAAPIKQIVKKSNLEYFTTYETLDDVRKNMMTSKYNRFPVVDEHGYIKGMISKGNLLNSKQKQAILVDHNEKKQSIDGIEEITLLEVIDHHRVADIQTMGPLYFRVEPVGCTSTIVAKMYEEHNVAINKEMATLMLSAILSDTLLFKSPTSTAVDEATAHKLAKIADIHLETYGMSVIFAGSDFENATPESILTTDVKPFMFGELKVKIAQTNTSDFNGFYEMFDITLDKMKMYCEMEQIDLYVLLVTDVVIGGTEIIAAGKAKWVVDQAFGMRQTENSIFIPGVFSRKKQVVPALMQAARL